MEYKPYQQRVSGLIDVYRKNPEIFNSRDLQELQSLAQEQGIEFDPNEKDASLLGVAGKIATGFLEGFTTINVGKEPTNTAEAIAHSLGHLAGFAPGIIAAPMALGVKAMTKLGYKGMAKKFSSGAQLAGRMNKYSVPMLGAGVVQKGFNRALAKSGLEASSFMRGSITRSIADQAVHLGAASMVSNVWKGSDAILDAGVHGALAGGAFGGIGNFVRLGNIIKGGTPDQVTKAEGILRASLGASIQGLPSVLHDEPIEMIIYNTLLGGFFGYSSQPSHKVEASKFIGELKSEPDQSVQFNPNLAKGWDKVTKKTQDYILDGPGNVNESAAKYVLRNKTGKRVDLNKLTEDQLLINEFIANQTKDRFNTNNPTDKQINTMYREEATKLKFKDEYSYEVVEESNRPGLDKRGDETDPVSVETNKDGNMVRGKHEQGNQKVYVMDFNLGGQVVKKLVYGKMTDAKESVGKKRFDVPIENVSPNSNYVPLTHIRRLITKGKNQGQMELIPILKSTKDFKTGENVRNVSKEEWWQMEHSLDLDGKYIYSGVKDKGYFLVADYHPAVLNAVKEGNLNRLVSEISKNLKDTEGIRNDMVDDLNKAREWFGDSGNKDAIRNKNLKEWASNVLHEAEIYGLYKWPENLSFDKLDRLVYKENTNPGVSKNVVDHTKRMQLFDDTGYPLNLEGDYKYAIFSDKINTKDGKPLQGHEKYFNSDTDGTIYYSDKAHREIQNEVGQDVLFKMNKPVIVSRLPEGILAVKSAGRKADGAIGKFMKDNNLDILMFKTAAKYHGDRIINELQFDGTNFTSKLNQADISLLPKRDIRVNLGVKESLKTIKYGSQLAKQAVFNLNSDQIGNNDWIEPVFKEVYERSLTGATKDNTVVKNYLETGKGDLNKIHPDNINVTEVFRLISNPKTENEKSLSKKFKKDIFNLNKENSVEEANGDVIDFTDIKNVNWESYINKGERILRASDFGPGTSNLMKNISNYSDNVIQKYVIQRFTNPHHKEAAKGVLAPVLPDTPIKEGTFKADKNWNPNVSFEGEPMRLQKLWNDYKAEKDPSRKVVYENALEFVGIRVPSDSISGSRVLRFNGFLDRKGVSVYTNKIDNYYLGGADKDIDAATFYQNFSDSAKKMYKKFKYEHQEGGKSKNEVTDAKDLTQNDFVGKADEYIAPISKFSPIKRKMAAFGSATGKDGVGIAISSRDKLISLRSVLSKDISKKGLTIKDGVATLKYTGEKDAKFEIKFKATKSSDDLKLYSRGGIQHSMDASNNPTIKSPSKFLQMFFNKSFKVESIKKNGKSIKKDLATEIIFDKKSPLRDISDVIGLADKHHSLSGNTLTPGQYAEKVNQIDFDLNYGNMQSKILKEMKKSGLHDLTNDIDLDLIQRMNAINIEIQKTNLPRNKDARDFLNKLTQTIYKLKSDIETGYNKRASFEIVGDSPSDIASFIKKKPSFAKDKVNAAIFTAASFNKIKESGLDIYKQLRANGLNKEESLKSIDHILKKISNKAIEIKNETYDNLQSSQGFDKFERLVFDYKENNIKINELQNNIQKGLLQDYFDYWLMSPFTTKDNIQGLINFSDKPLQSSRISYRALEGTLKEYERIFEKVTKSEGTVAEVTADIKATIPKSQRVIEKIESSSGPAETSKNRVEDIVNKIVKVKEGKRAFRVEDVIINNEDIAHVKELRRNLSKNPEFSQNMEEWFPAFHYDMVGVHKEYNAMNMADVIAVNKYLKNITSRASKKWGTKVPNWVFRADPRTIDEHMASIDAKTFISFERPVIQRTGEVKFRDVKTFTSTIGSMKEFNRRIMNQEDAYVKAIETEFNERLEFRNKLSIEDSTNINDLVIMKREGVDYKNTDLYKKLIKKTFKYADIKPDSEKIITKKGDKVKIDLTKKSGKRIKGKEFTLDSMIETVDKEYTKIIKEVSEKWIHKPTDPKKLSELGYVNGKIDLKTFLRRTIEPAAKGYDLRVTPLETLLEYNYEYLKQKRMKSSKLTNKEYVKRFGEFIPVGKFKSEEYFPHLNFAATKKAEAEIKAFKEGKIQDAYDTAISNGMSKKNAAEIAAAEALKWEMVKESGELLSSGIAKGVIDSINENVNFVELTKKADGIGLNKRAPNILDRQFDMPGYDRGTYVIDSYKESIIRDHYKLLQAAMGNHQIDRFIRESKFGKDTNDWAFVLKDYLRNSLGHQTTFHDDLREATGISRRMEDILKGSLYYKMSDSRVIKGWDKVDGWFKKRASKMPFSKNLPQVTADRKTNPELYKQQLKARRDYQSRVIHELGRKEAKFQLMTLLANTGTATANIFGGSSMTIASAGLRNFRRANNGKWLTNNLLKNSKGDFYLKLKNGDTVKDTAGLKSWIAEKGIIDNFIQNELLLNTEWQAEMSKNKDNVKNFFKKATEIIKKNPEVADESLLELAKRYNINKALLKGGAFFMSASERKLRTDAFISHALQYRDAYGKMIKDLPLNDPAVIEAGLKGIEATQFLYHSAFRPAYMRTSLGKVMTRFKLFAFQSVRTRKELYRRAKYYGFEPGTQSFEKFKNLFAIDMMTLALGAAFKYSLFDTALPPPWDWVQETSEWLFGDKHEREKAFFGQYPYPIAPLQIATPPIARIPMSTFSALINNDWDRFMDYNLHTMYPFGRIVRQFDKTFYDKGKGSKGEIINEAPYGTTFGRGMQQFFRLPTDKLVSRMDKAQLKRAKVEGFRRQLENLQEGDDYGI